MVSPYAYQTFSQREGKVGECVTMRMIVKFLKMVYTGMLRYCYTLISNRSKWTT